MRSLGLNESCIDPCLREVGVSKVVAGCMLML